uniref:Transmembrane protein n=2 Tax=Caenorhabditis tropicalis TaxID=1561998 RepID=A0A1I7V2V3_9PELO
MMPIPVVASSAKFKIHATNVVGGPSHLQHTMIDFNNMHQIVSHRVPTTRISTFLVTLISFLLVLVLFSTCVMCITYVRRRLKRRQESGLLCRDETSETLIESTLINSDTQTMYSAIDV